MTKDRQFEDFIDNLKLPNFKGSEFTPYWSKVRNGISNSVPAETLWLNIVPTLVILQMLRTKLGHPVILSSTYRSFKYNKAIGGAEASYHMKFIAIDFYAATGTPKQWADILKSYRGKRFELPGVHGKFTFKGGIGIYTNKNFVHIDTRGNNPNWEY